MLYIALYFRSKSSVVIYELLPRIYFGHDLSSDRELSLLQARGDTLLSAAQTMVKYYGELSTSANLDASLAELDASMTIAQVLGSTSIEHFEEMWNQATALSDPKAVARYAYGRLTDS